MDRQPVYCLFVDESSQTAHRYLSLGCLAIEEAWLKGFEFSISHAKHLELRTGELKWSKISAAKLHAYKLVIDRFFDHGDVSTPIHFHSLVIDTSKIRDDTYNKGDREIGFNKEVYQLLMKCARLYPTAHFKVYADHRDTSFSMDELRSILNAGARKKGDARVTPFRLVQFCDSKKFLPLQMTDLLLGAITFQINGHHKRRDASRHKCHLSDYVLARSAITDPMRDTSLGGKVTIWHRKLRD
ncbi:DUF3800 domain-containing protein [Rhizobium bangladeshense]|uniref:DUF3800 domain-containing protein n=1 Tax=Rhizobium bangladeshense TaxID=1138189 RepID=UPI0007E59C8B|nr:DUF3800 domain-containing protein [Rhizobium bangladeshense]